MESVVSLIIISAFLFIVFGYAMYLQDNHIKRKKLYMLYKNKKEGFIVGGQEKTKQSKQNKQSNVKCSDNPCKNGSKCIEDKVKYDKTTMNYRCECKKGYSGYNCEFRNEASKGVRVDLLKKDVNLAVIPIIKKIYMFDRGKNTWNNYL